MKYIAGIFFLLLWPSPAPAQPGETPYESYLEEGVSVAPFSRQEWEKAIEGLDYSESPETRRQRETEAAASGSEGDRGEVAPARRRGFRMSEGMGQAVLNFLVILGVAVALIFLLRALLGLENTPRNKKIQRSAGAGPIDLANIEENIHESDLEAYIQQALAEKNYVLAIRLYYLAILKELSVKKAIRWKRDKTNRQYLREMQRSPLSGSFADVTLIFERVWYGNQAIGEADYRQLEPKFRNLAEQVKANA